MRPLQLVLLIASIVSAELVAKPNTEQCLQSCSSAFRMCMNPYLKPATVLPNRWVIEHSSMIDLQFIKTRDGKLKGLEAVKVYQQGWRINKKDNHITDLVLQPLSAEIVGEITLTSAIEKRCSSELMECRKNCEHSK